MATAVVIAVVFAAVLAGSFLQRVSGMGVGLIAAPLVSLLIGPVEGVMVINLLAVVNALITTWTVRRNVNWRNFGLISSVLIVGAIPGALLIRVVSADLLMVIVGALLLIALSIVTLGKRYVPVASGTIPALFAGVVGGFMNTLAGVAGPAITVYAQAARWEQRMYAATLQPIFIVSGLVSFLIKLVSGVQLEVTGWVWPAGMVAMLLGIFLGVRLSAKIQRVAAHRLALGLAVFGGVITLVRGLVGLF